MRVHWSDAGTVDRPTTDHPDNSLARSTYPDEALDRWPNLIKEVSELLFGYLVMQSLDG